MLKTCFWVGEGIERIKSEAEPQTKKWCPSTILLVACAFAAGGWCLFLILFVVYVSC